MIVSTATLGAHSLHVLLASTNKERLIVTCAVRDNTVISIIEPTCCSSNNGESMGWWGAYHNETQCVNAIFDMNYQVHIV